MSEQDKNSSRGFVDQPSAPPSPPYYYGTFQGVVNSHPPPPSQPVVGYPQPVPPVGYYSHELQSSKRADQLNVHSVLATIAIMLGVTKATNAW
ncbi:hypothetical protein AG4045_020891 [Apium graveolens]|uniref:Uncharacterized protein n=1 Tax=Apium graveolens TaxID=4045 RepID=A0A6L5BBU7_APIGR|nr:hypothetical protein AG4045_020891 [Apium graveolens]